MVGGRDSDYAMAFIGDLQSRLANRVQLTTDGRKAYLDAVEDAFGADVVLQRRDRFLRGRNESTRQHWRSSESALAAPASSMVPIARSVVWRVMWGPPRLPLARLRLAQKKRLPPRRGFVLAGGADQPTRRRTAED
jgi:hypothetical protein